MSRELVIQREYKEGESVTIDELLASIVDTLDAVVTSPTHETTRQHAQETRRMLIEYQNRKEGE